MYNKIICWPTMFTVTFWVQESEICIDISQASIACLNFMWHQIQLWKEKTDEVFDGFEFMSKKTLKFIFNTWFTLMDITWLSKKNSRYESKKNIISLFQLSYMLFSAWIYVKLFFPSEITIWFLYMTCYKSS